MNNPHLPVEDRPDDERDAIDRDNVEETSGAMPFIHHLEDLRKSLWKASQIGRAHV